jgi:phosphopantothenoylcysteine decarboxylase/phosphopantothenate--cysteine ligase
MGHINLSRAGASAIVVAPASADFLAKGCARPRRRLLSTLCLARDCPLLVAPAMNRQMWGTPRRNATSRSLRADGRHRLGPGTRRSGLREKRRRPDARSRRRSSRRSSRRSQPKLLARQAGADDAGPTFEAIDPVRGITNSSSGKMGYRDCAAAAEAAPVTLVSGSDWLADAARRHARSMCAAAADGRRVERNVAPAICSSASRRWPTTRRRAIERKTRRATRAHDHAQADGRHSRDDCRATERAVLRRLRGGKSHNVLPLAEEKRRRKNVPLLVANRAQDALGSDQNEVILLDAAAPIRCRGWTKLACAQARRGNRQAAAALRRCAIHDLRQRCNDRVARARRARSSTPAAYATPVPPGSTFARASTPRWSCPWRDCVDSDGDLDSHR